MRAIGKLSHISLFIFPAKSGRQKEQGTTKTLPLSPYPPTPTPPHSPSYAKLTVKVSVNFTQNYKQNL
ncbi:hypothetical protein E5S67_02899 [Microcoleus sp. IPMA8]|uniref:Uncharacterized protein n=1 Tax=Microcoleus asticus IPMA8 TaxID=2563858 RepID=A0ABX2CXQ4_9CYAN|nr:hypothetical protein [Microcoleus asticus IPMA8]